MALRLVGQAVKRIEDPKLLTGRGRYIDDVKLPDMLYAVFARSRYAHAKIARIDKSSAMQVAGAVAVHTGEELARELKPLPKLGMQGLKEPEIYPLAVGKVRYVGEPVALCVATEPYAAYDMAEALEIKYEPLPAIIDPERSAETREAVLYEELGDNVSLKLEFKGGDIDAAFSEAEVVIKRRIRLNRTTGASIEPRGSVARYVAPTGQIELWSSTQFPHVYRGFISRYLGIPENKVRVIACDIGGGFGVKVHFFREDLALCYASMKLGRPVKWFEDRSENLASSIHEREQIHYVEIACKRDGTVLAVKDRCIADLGAFGALPWAGGALSMFTSVLLPGPYKLKAYLSEHIAVFTNKAPYGAVRGPALLQANYVIERVMDIAARELGIDPAEIRLKNLVRREDQPFTSLSGETYNAASFEKCLEKLMEAMDYRRLREEQRAMRGRGEYMGIGFSILAEYSAFSSAVNSLFGMGGFDSVVIRVEPSGMVSVYSGLVNLGQGIETALAQVVADRLQIPISHIAIVTGDTLYTPYGIGSHSSRAGLIGGNAAAIAAERVLEKMKQIAASMLEAKPEDIRYEARRFYVAGAPEKSVSFEDVVKTAYVNAHKLPPGAEPGIEATCYFEPRAAITWANAAHGAVVSVDPETGATLVKRYYVVEDCGNVINPLIAEGQIIGGVVQGIGHIVYEDLAYSGSGELLSRSFMDYLLPSATEAPEVEVDYLLSPAPDNPGGYKGLGEGGTIAAPAAIVNAVEDALEPMRATIPDAPLSPYMVWRSLRAPGTKA